MNQTPAKAVTSRSYIPTLPLLGIIIVAAVVVFSTGAGKPAVELPEVSVGRAAVLMMVGLVAGLLGGLIKTGGCSVVLPVLGFWGWA
ncbi:MAG: hypothetical protein H5T84_06200, partial [Thermoleophilia bacterium]|nr:hypothetical protein [Thermoleophilia bacterium]